MKYNRLECVDAGSDYCPCYLAETNDCITCSNLRGQDFCDCNWRGVCIYQEYVWNGYKSKVCRETIEGDIIEKTEISSNSTLLKIKVTKTLARQLKEPGAYIFLRNSEMPGYFDMPMSVMETDDLNGYVYIAYQKLGTKTKRLDEVKDKLLIRGPYWNGILGLSNLKRVAHGTCLIIVRGIAQAPSVLVTKKLIKNNNEVILIVDKGKVGKVFIGDFLNKLNLNIIEENVFNDSGRYLIENILKNKKIDLVYSGGSDRLHASVINIIDKLNINPYLVITNNSQICCGEGICGSCATHLENGSTVKTCKTQIDARKVIERRVSID